MLFLSTYYIILFFFDYDGRVEFPPYLMAVARSHSFQFPWFNQGWMTWRGYERWFLVFGHHHGDRRRFGRDAIITVEPWNGVPAFYTSRETRDRHDRICHWPGSLYVHYNINEDGTQVLKNYYILDFVTGTFVPSIPQIAKDLNSTGSVVG